MGHEIKVLWNENLGKGQDRAADATTRSVTKVRASGSVPPGSICAKFRICCRVSTRAIFCCGRTVNRSINWTLLQYYSTVDRSMIQHRSCISAGSAYNSMRESMIIIGGLSRQILTNSKLLVHELRCNFTVYSITQPYQLCKACSYIIPVAYNSWLGWTVRVRPWSGFWSYLDWLWLFRLLTDWWITTSSLHCVKLSWPALGHSHFIVIDCYIAGL